MYVWYFNLNLGHLSKKIFIYSGSLRTKPQVDEGFVDKHHNFRCRDLLSILKLKCETIRMILMSHSIVQILYILYIDILAIGNKHVKWELG